MRRREVVRLLAGAAMCPGTVRAQPGRVRRVGFLWDSPTVTPDDLVAFRERGGVSMGGNIALELALSHPDQINGLILASTGSGSDNPDEFRKRVNGWANFALTQGIARFAEMIMKVPVFAEYADRGGSERQWMYDAITSSDARGVAHTARRVLGGRPSVYEWEESLGQLTVPTLVLAGAHDEPCCKMGAYLARTIPDAKFTVVRDVGHFVNLEAPSEFNAAIAAFLDETEAAGPRSSPAPTR